MSFLDINFPDLLEYSSDEEPIPLEFYLDVLPKSKIIYLKLGYFSSKAIQVLSLSFAQFIYNGGVMKIITNHFLYKDDLELLEGFDDVDYKIINKKFVHDLKWIHDNLQESSQHFIDCLKYLVSKNKLELIPVMLKPNRMAHFKQGIFIDDVDNKIFMDGSCNFTANGLLENGENISFYRSWGSEIEKKKVERKSVDLEKLTNKSNDKYVYLDKSHILNAVNSIGAEKNIYELLDDELNLMQGNNYKHHVKLVLEKYEDILKEKIRQIKVTPKFPFNSSPRDYQIKAYENWVESKKQGIFAMATGTGKTITSLNCLLNEYEESGSYQSIILVPTKILLEQWRDEALSFNFRNIYLVSSDYKWKPIINELNTNLLVNKNKSFVLIVTYQTFSSDSFQKKITNLPSETLLIADEAHNIGAEKIKKLLPDIKYSKRIALSATPKRNYDEEGNKIIEEYFNSEEPYTFSFSMERAINEGILCHYNYFPHIVYLNEEEMVEYIEITKKLSKFFDSKTKQYKKSSIVEALLLARKRIIHKAENKLEIFRKIIEDYKESKGNLKYTFVYAPEGIDKNDKNLLDRYMDALEEIAPYTKAYSYTHHSENKKEVMKNFEDGYTDVLFSMKCLDEGVDIPRAELAIFCSSTGNPRQFIQRRGRILRTHPDKKTAVIHDLIVVPRKETDDDTFQIEKNMIRGELVRVIYFSSLSDNYYSSMDVCKHVAEMYDLDMYALEDELRGES